MTEVKSFLRRFEGKLRIATRLECRAVGESYWDHHFIPDLRPLGRPATADDVAAGKAIFHLDRPAKPTSLELPAVAELPQTEKERRFLVLILQAEQDEAGATTYGVITSLGIETLPADKLTKVRSLKQYEAELKAAAEKMQAETETK